MVWAKKIDTKLVLRGFFVIIVCVDGWPGDFFDDIHNSPKHPKTMACIDDSKNSGVASCDEKEYDLPPLQFGREHVGHGMLWTGDIDIHGL